MWQELYNQSMLLYLDQLRRRGDAVRKWQLENPEQALNKVTFLPLLKSAIEYSIKPEYLVKGLKLCGLCPFNADAVDYSVFGCPA